MYTNRFRGFTLIELLVVIAIIGILSAVVLASLNTARSKGNDAAIQSDLSTVQTEAEIYYGGTGNNSYGPAFTLAACPTVGTYMFTTDSVISKAIAGAESASAGTATCFASASAYVVQAPLATGGYWCVDSTGTASKSTTAYTTGTTCP